MKVQETYLLALTVGARRKCFPDEQGHEQRLRIGYVDVAKIEQTRKSEK